MAYVSCKNILVCTLMLAGNVCAMDKMVVVPSAQQDLIYPVRTWQETKKFAGHMIAYDIQDKNVKHVLSETLVKYGFISNSRSEVEVYSRGYKLNQFPKFWDSLNLNFNWDNQNWLHYYGKNIFMRHIRPQEAREYIEKIGSEQESWCFFQYRDELNLRLEFRAQQEDSQEPSLNVISTQENLSKLNSWTPEQAQECLNEWDKTDFYYYVPKEEQKAIYQLLLRIAQSKKNK